MRPFTPRGWLRGGHVQTLASFLIQRRIPSACPRGAPHRSRTWDQGALPLPLAGRSRSRAHDHRRARTRRLERVAVHARSHRESPGCGDERHPLQPAQLRRHRRARSCALSFRPVERRRGGGARRDCSRRCDRVSPSSGFSMGGNIVLKLAGEWGAAGAATASRGRRRAVRRSISRRRRTRSTNLRTASTKLTFLWALRRRMLQKARLFPTTLRYSADCAASAACASSTTRLRRTIADLPELTITTIVPPRRTWSTGSQFRRWCCTRPMIRLSTSRPRRAEISREQEHHLRRDQRRRPLRFCGSPQRQWES